MTVTDEPDVRLKLKLAMRGSYCRDAPKYLTFNGFVEAQPSAFL